MNCAEFESTLADYVDGTLDAAEASGRKLKSAYPMLQVQVYDAEKKTRTLLS